MRKSLLFILGFVCSSPSYAEIGDYDFITTVINLIAPFGADNPVTPGQMEGAYPLLNNPAGFGDGYNPNGWYAWQTVQLHPSTGAVCGNGSPYKFFVNRAPNTSNTVIYMEGGGACWDYESCTGSSPLGARNPNGIPDNYLDISNPATSLVSPFVFRFNPWSQTKVQAWNLVYVPYCTGDLYTGDKVALYDSEDGTDSIVWHHNGLRNTRAVLAWLKNNVPRPGQALMTGCSAGGGGSISNYAHFREDLDPTRSFMINDSGPIYPAPDGGNPAVFPSVPLQQQVRAAWGLDEGPSVELAARLPGFNPGDLGTLNSALAARFPNDRLGHTHFLADLNYSRYSYEKFYDEIANAPNEQIRNTLLTTLWVKDTVNLLATVDPIDNYGIYVPFFRNLNDSHCSTIVDFENGDIQEQALELEDFINSVLDGEGPVLEAVETDTAADLSKPFNLLYYLIDQLL